MAVGKFSSATGWGEELRFVASLLAIQPNHKPAVLEHSASPCKKMISLWGKLATHNDIIFLQGESECSRTAGLWLA